MSTNKVKRRKISDLKFDQQNINKGSEYGMSLLEKSLQEVGLGRSILTDMNDNIIAGNKTVEQAAALGFENIVEVESDGNTLIVVKRTDLDINTERGIKAKILDNSVSKHNYIEDAEVVDAICEEYQIDRKEYGLAKKALLEAEEEEPSGYDQQQQWFLNIRCEDEAQCQLLYEKLTGEGLDVKIVT